MTAPQVAYQVASSAQVHPSPVHCPPPTDWGVEMAGKGGVEADRVLNAMPLPKLLRQHAREVRRTAQRSAVAA